MSKPFTKKTDRWQSLLASHPPLASLPEDSIHQCQQLITVSDFANTILQRYPAFLFELAQSEAIALPLPDLSAVNTLGALQKSLLEARQKQWLRLLWLSQFASLSEESLMQALSHFADECLRAAYEKIYALMIADKAAPLNEAGQRIELIIIALGKLGGSALNFSSDVDLVFAYQGAAEHERFFNRLVQQLIAVMRAEGGSDFIFRVDTRLRPFGESGPLVMRLAAMESYYQQHGRNWERYALVKGRVITGGESAEKAYETIRRPFVYRRYLDFNVIETLRDLKAKFAEFHAPEVATQDVKKGEGGIRQVEFVVQAFQLIRGGRVRPLRTTRFKKALDVIAQQQLLAEAICQQLSAAYDFLRKAENRLQMLQDRQTHCLPDDEAEKSKLAWLMGCESYADFLQALDEHRKMVSAQFSQLVLVDETLPLPPPENVREQLAQFNAEKIEKYWQRLQPIVIKALQSITNPQQSLARFLLLIDAVAKRPVYFTLLLENAAVVQRLLQLLGHSQWLADLIIRRPILLDELIDPRLWQPRDSIGQLTQSMDEQLQLRAGESLEEQLEDLQQFKEAQWLHCIADELADRSNAVRAAKQLARIAEVVVQKALLIAWQQLAEKQQLPKALEGSPAGQGIVIVAYGRLGEGTLTYDSDIDLIFLHQADSEETRQFYLRLSQRIIHLLTMPTAGGCLYAVDTRLRPGGSAGLLVSHFEGFEAYQLESAQIWEHQALVKARAVAGDETLQQQFIQLRQTLLQLKRSPEKLLQAITDMRDRIDREKAKRDPYSRLRFGLGGINDIEFLVQYYVLLQPKYGQQNDTQTLLASLASDQILPINLIKIYETYQQWLHCRVFDALHPIDADLLAHYQQQVCKLWSTLIDEAQ